MKFLFLVTMLGLCSCATGVSDPVEEQEEVYVAPPKRPPPKESDPEPTDPAPVLECKVIDYWAGDCYVLEIHCKDKLPQIEIACGPGRPLWPWEIEPDPPFDNRK